uniref:Uncharacterized protein n=1 Tax=Romanomermis culicivorax TaxID=13658 RepID=A0A915JDG3_ROMCU
MQWIGSAKMDIVGQGYRLPMQLRLKLQSRTTARAALSTGPMEITNLGCGEALDIVIEVEMLVGGFEDGTDIKAEGGKDAVVMLGGADFVTAGSKSIGLQSPTDFGVVMQHAYIVDCLGRRATEGVLILPFVKSSRMHLLSLFTLSLVQRGIVQDVLGGSACQACGSSVVHVLGALRCSTFSCCWVFCLAKCSYQVGLQIG